MTPPLATGLIVWIRSETARKERENVSELTFRPAEKRDIPSLVALLSDDPLGQSRERAQREDLSPYEQAFLDIESDKGQFLCVVEHAGHIVGTLQLSFIPGLSRGGAKRGQIEAVRVHRDRRGEGIGEAMFRWAIEECRSRGCSLIQLTTDKSRSDAHRFYDVLGFVPSHVGYKMSL